MRGFEHGQVIILEIYIYPLILAFSRREKETGFFSNRLGVILAQAGSSNASHTRTKNAV